MTSYFPFRCNQVRPQGKEKELSKSRLDVMQKVVALTNF